jgi:hypothetical protein
MKAKEGISTDISDKYHWRHVDKNILFADPFFF